MTVLLIFILAQMAGRIPHSQNLDESVYIAEVKMPTVTNHDGLASRRFRYPPYGSGKEYLIRPRCYDIRDEDTGQGTTSPVRHSDETGFTVVAPAGHTVKVTCRVVKAKGPLA